MTVIDGLEVVEGGGCRRCLFFVKDGGFAGWGEFQTQGVFRSSPYTPQPLLLGLKGSH